MKIIIISHFVIFILKKDMMYKGNKNSCVFWWNSRNGVKKNDDTDFDRNVHKKTPKHLSNKQDNMGDKNESEGRQLRSRGEKQRQKVDW